MTFPPCCTLLSAGSVQPPFSCPGRRTFLISYQPPLSLPLGDFLGGGSDPELRFGARWHGAVMGRAIAITRQDHSAADLRRVAGGSRDGALVRRLLALALVLEGCSRGGAARQSGMDRQTPCDWVHRYETEGVGGLGSRRSPGRAPALSQGRMAALKTLVIDGPDPERHKVVRWRCCDLQREIARLFWSRCMSGRLANGCAGLV